jgi:hypothetical protein
MTTKFISRREHGTRVEYSRVFMRAKGAGGFAFPCDEQGNLVARSNGTRVAELVADPAYRDHGVMRDEWPTVAAAVIECEICKAHVALHGFTNTCGCGADYNMSGDMLADRSQWGAETGESQSDILVIDGSSPP